MHRINPAPPCSSSATISRTTPTPPSSSPGASTPSPTVSAPTHPSPSKSPAPPDWRATSAAPTTSPIAGSRSPPSLRCWRSWRWSFAPPSPPRCRGRVLPFSLLFPPPATRTLMPPLPLLIGNKLFWRPFGSPGLLAPPDASRWRRLATGVARRPMGVLVVLLLVLLVPIVHSFGLDSRVDLDSDSLKNTSSMRGRALAERYFGGSILFPWSCLIQFPVAPAPEQLKAISTTIDQTLLAAGARDVWSLTQPLGRSAAGAAMLLPWLAPRAADLYYNPIQRTLRVEVMAGDSPFSPAAVTEFEQTFRKIHQLPQLQQAHATVLATGASPL